MSYLSAMGVGSIPVSTPASLTVSEKVIETTLSEMLMLVERHLAWWKKTQSKVTIEALLSTERVMLTLLTALYQPQNRVAHVIAALHGVNFNTLVKSIRCPRGRESDAEVQLFRATVTEDRNQFKMLLRKSVKAVIHACRPEYDQTLVEAVLHMRVEGLDAFFRNMEAAVDAIDVTGEVVAEENEGALVPATQPVVGPH